MYLDDLTLLEWQEDLECKSVPELADWIVRQRIKAYIDGQLDNGQLERLFQEWQFLYETPPEELPEELSPDLSRIFVRNQKVLRGKSDTHRKRSHYRKAVLFLNTPIPRFQYRPKGDTHAIHIRHWVFKENPALSMQQILRQVEQDIQTFDRIMDRTYANASDYRGKLREWIQKREGLREIPTYKAPGHSKADIQQYEKEMAQKGIYYEELVYGRPCAGGIRTPEQFGLNRPLLLRWMKGACEKNTMIRLAFFLGLTEPAAERLLQKEGFSLSASVRVEDEILRKCFRFGFPIHYANQLLANQGKKPLPGVTVS